MPKINHPIAGEVFVPDSVFVGDDQAEVNTAVNNYIADIVVSALEKEGVEIPSSVAFSESGKRIGSETIRGIAEATTDQVTTTGTQDFMNLVYQRSNPYATFLGGLAGGAGDPTNVASALMPLQKIKQLKQVFGPILNSKSYLWEAIKKDTATAALFGALAPEREDYGEDILTNIGFSALGGTVLGGARGTLGKLAGAKTDTEIQEILDSLSASETQALNEVLDTAGKNIIKAEEKALELESPQAFEARKREEEVLDLAQTRADKLQKEAQVQQIRDQGDAAGAKLTEEAETARVADEFKQNLEAERNATLNFQMRRAQEEINAGRQAEYDQLTANITNKVKQDRIAELEFTLQSKIGRGLMDKTPQDAAAALKKTRTAEKRKLTAIDKRINALESGKVSKDSKGMGINALRQERDRLQSNLDFTEGELKVVEDLGAARKELATLKKNGTSPVVEQRIAQQLPQRPAMVEPTQVPMREVAQPTVQDPAQLQAIPEAFAGAPSPAPVAPTAPPNVGTSSGRFSQGQVQRIAPEAPVSPSQPRSTQTSATPQGAVETRPEFKRAGGVDRALGAISTRLRDAFPTVFQGIRDVESQIARLSNTPVNRSKPFFDELKRLRPQAQIQIKGHLYNGRFDEAKELMGPVMRKSFNDIRKELSNIRQLANAAGMDIPLVDNYFPRSVKDLKGLREALGRGPYKGEVEKVLQEYRDKNGVSVIPSEIEADLINKVVSGIKRRPQVQLGGGKGKRTVGEIPDELLQFYDEPAEALTRYFQRMGRDIPINKFMGNHAVRDTEGNLVLEGNDGSIGRMIADMRMKGNLSADEEAELLDILSARFIQGEKAMNKFLAGGRDLGYIGTIGNIASAIVNLGDLGTSAGLHGLKNTIAAMFGKTGGNKYDVIDMGIDHTVANELRDNKTTARWLNTVFKASQFQRLDRLAKNTSMNAAMRKNEALAKSEKGKAQLRKKWGAAYGDEVEVLIRDLEQKQVTPRTQLLAFHELSDMQPISLSEASQYYLNNPDMRLLYMLKSFTLKQYDIVRREVIREYAKGNKMGAATKAAALLGYMTAANVGTQTVQDFALGRDIEPEAITNKALWTLLGVFGLNKYVIDRYLKQGDVSGAAQAYLFPPMSMFDSAGKLVVEGSKALEGEEYNLAKASRALPIVGPVVYSYFGGGAENFNTRQEAELWKKKLKSMGYEVD